MNDQCTVVRLRPSFTPTLLGTVRHRRVNDSKSGHLLTLLVVHIDDRIRYRRRVLCLPFLTLTFLTLQTKKKDDWYSGLIYRTNRV